MRGTVRIATALLDAVAAADLCFLVDPVDGTANFCAGLPLFGTIVAVIRRGVVVGAVIHDPVGDDTAVAAAGQGAWLETASGERVALHVAAPMPLAAMAGRVCIVEAEKIVEVGELAPDDIHLPGIFVHRLVELTAQQVEQTKWIEKTTTNPPSEGQR